MRATIDRTLLDKVIRRFPRGSTVVEIGWIRGSRRGAKGNGHSSLRWAKEGFQVFAVDANERAVENCRKICREYPNVSVIPADGIKFLESFSGMIDILFLDSVGPKDPEWKKKHWEMFLAGKDKLSDNGVIIVDDVDVHSFGKGEWIMNGCEKYGFDYSVHGSMCLVERPSAQRQKLPKRVLAGPWVGEFGWELFCWQGHLRWLHQTKGMQINVIGRPGHEALYRDFCHQYFAKPIPSDSVSCWENRSYSNSEDQELGSDYDLHLRPQIDPPVRYNVRRLRKDRRFADQVFVRLGQPDQSDQAPRIIIHGRQTNKCGSAKRNWPTDNWFRLVSELQQLGLRIGCIGSKEAALHSPGTTDLRGVPLEKLVDVLASADLIIGPSSGPMHLATLCGLPQLVWSVRRNRQRYLKDWNPFGTKVRFVSEHGWNPPVDRIVAETHSFFESKPRKELQA